MFDRSTIQGRSTVLPGLAPDPFVELHADDAKRLGVATGDSVDVATAAGQHGAAPPKCRGDCGGVGIRAFRLQRSAGYQPFNGRSFRRALSGFGRDEGREATSRRRTQSRSGPKSGTFPSPGLR